MLQIEDIEYEIIDSKERITIADSFVLPSNKIGNGNGEAKLYIGHYDESIINFFGNRGFCANCFLTKNNLIEYLEAIYPEYSEPSQEYRQKTNMLYLWKTRFDKVMSLDEIVPLRLNDQDQIVGPRLYVNSTDSAYTLIREISLPIISYLDIFKLRNQETFEINYYIQLRTIDPDGQIDDSIEKELENDQVILESPFDPNKIKVRTSPSTIGQIIDDLEDGIIDLYTEFQRHPNLWDSKRKSRFIESLLLKLPIPAFYFNERQENQLEVVDGLQRISTIKDFVIDKILVLNDLEFLKEFNGRTIGELPIVLKRRIKTFPITTYVIEKDTPADVKYNIFKRVNTGGLVLLPQEIRHALNQGKPANLIADLVRGVDIQGDNRFPLNATAEGIAFIKATDNSVGVFRMEDRDFATRFVSFYLIPFQEYKPDLDTFLNYGMSKINDLNEDQVRNIKLNFKEAMELAYDIFEHDAFRKRYHRFDSRKPINKALFETLSVLFAKMSMDQRNILRQRKNQFIENFITLMNNPDGKFLNSISQGTAQKDKVEQRFSDISQLINLTLR